MDPFTLGAVWALIVVVLVNIVQSRKKASPSKPPKAVEESAPSPDHRLVKTWIEQYSSTVVAGWRAKCSCGVVCYATNTKEHKSYGSEGSAVDAFELHAKNFSRVNGNPVSDKLKELQQKLDEQQANCFCKDVSSVELIPLKD